MDDLACDPGRLIAGQERHEPRRVFGRIGPLNTVRVTAVLMTGIAIPSAFLMFHYKRLYSYTSDENVFFAVTFSLSFLLGSPCALTGMFG